MMTMEKKTRTIPIRFPAEEAERLDRFAEETMRSLNGSVRHLVKEALDARDREKEHSNG